MAKTVGARRSAKNGAQAPIISDHGLALAVYVLYLLGFFTGLTAVIGAIIAYMQSDRADETVRTHFRFQVKTFLIGLLYVFIAAITFHVAIGGLVLLWWVVWTVIRCVKGLLALNADEPIAEPDSWLFG
jgi:uncharacterized membrane protein